MKETSIASHGAPENLSVVPRFHLAASPCVAHLVTCHMCCCVSMPWQIRFAGRTFLATARALSEHGARPSVRM